jgi:hypothetical protein
VVKHKWHKPTVVHTECPKSENRSSGEIPGKELNLKT